MKVEEFKRLPEERQIEGTISVEEFMRLSEKPHRRKREERDAIDVKAIIREHGKFLRTLKHPKVQYVKKQRKYILTAVVDGDRKQILTSSSNKPLIEIMEYILQGGGD